MQVAYGSSMLYGALLGPDTMLHLIRRMEATGPCLTVFFRADFRNCTAEDQSLSKMSDPSCTFIAGHLYGSEANSACRTRRAVF